MRTRLLLMIGLAGMLLSSAACGPASAEAPWKDALWQTPRASEVDTEATAHLRGRLIEEVDKVVDAGVLAPLCLAYGDIPGQAIWLYVARGRIITTLASAYPHLPEDRQARVRSYVRAMLDDPREQPWQPGLKGHTAGERRELHGHVYPAELRWMQKADEWPVLHVYYGLWLYGDRTGDWSALGDRWEQIKAGYLRDAARENLVLYGQLSGHVGMARLAHRFGDEAMLEKVTALAGRDFKVARDPAAMEERQKQTFFAVYHDLRHRDPPRRGYFHGQPWMFLSSSPEVMRFIGRRAAEASLRRIEAFVRRYPVWWVSQSPYFTRWTGDESVGLAAPQSIGMVFPFQRWLMEVEPEELRRLLRSSPTGIGDCHWMEAAVSAIEASGEVSWEDVRLNQTGRAR